MVKTNLEKIVKIGVFMDIYGELLTDKQREFVKMHYEEDMSFQEIAKVAGVTRQAVFDAVKNAEESFEKFESKLKLAEKNLMLSETSVDIAPDNSKTGFDQKFIEKVKSDLMNLKIKIFKQGVIYNSRWIISDIEEIINILSRDKSAD